MRIKTNFRLLVECLVEMLFGADILFGMCQLCNTLPQAQVMTEYKKKYHTLILCQSKTRLMLKLDAEQCTLDDRPSKVNEVSACLMQGSTRLVQYGAWQS